MKQITQKNPYYVIAFSTFFIIFGIFVYGFFSAPDAGADAPCFAEVCGSIADVCHGGGDWSCFTNPDPFST